MAKFVICSIYDRAVKCYSAPMFLRSIDEARRSFGDAVMDPKLELGRHPADYSLVCLGEWDDNGTLSPLKDGPDRLMDAVDCIPYGNAPAPGVDPKFMRTNGPESI